MPTMTNRDLASVDIWERSLERSQRRRVLADSARKEQSRKKTASLAVTAAVATAPVWPTVAATANDLSKNDASRLARKMRHDHVERVLLKKGDSNSAVLAIQKALKVQADGVYGPQTQDAIKQFQASVGLPTTGDVPTSGTDVRGVGPPAVASMP